MKKVGILGGEVAWAGKGGKGEPSTFKELLFPALGLAPADLPAGHARIFSERVFQSGV